MKVKGKILSASLCFALVGGAHAQNEGSLGVRNIKSYWIEGGAFLVVFPTVPFANPAGCNLADRAVVPSDHPAYKQIYAAVVHAMATNTPVSLYGRDCYTAWNTTIAMFYAIGVGTN